jgi:short-subunit dehydrogenase
MTYSPVTAIMKLGPGVNVLITGATGGLGSPITRALAQTGVNLALVAYPGLDLEELRQTVEVEGAKRYAIKYDLRDREHLPALLEEVAVRIGPVDVLINNAGVEYTSAYHELSLELIRETLAVNLEAPMSLCRLLLPGMLARKSGHFVNISSLAGLAKPAFQEPYSATKAGLIGFTGSLRATYRNQGVSASVVIPGFVEAGIYARLKETSGRSAPPLIGACAPERVAHAVLRAINSDLPEVYVSKYPVKPILTLSALSPAFGAWATKATGVNAFFENAVKAVRDGSKRG